MASPDDLASIVRQAQRFEERAFKRLVEVYSPRLYGFMFRFTGRREDAEDLTQEVFVRVVRAIETYRDDGQFEAWLFRIAANMAKDRLRRIRCAPAITSLDCPVRGDEERKGAGEGECSPETNSPADKLQMAEDVDRLQEGLAMLSEEQRETILLRHYGQMSFAQIAAITGVPLGTALARAHRGLARLRAWMEPSR
ncbi:MAG: RNA polymerase sigma factor [Phycisphaerae bacterium]